MTALYKAPYPGDQVTGLVNKKYTNISLKDTADGKLKPIWDILFKAGTDQQISNMQDLILLRFADVLLMQSELKADATGLNAVRNRVGLAPVAGYSEAALRAERRSELAFEGLRWFDELRWNTIADDIKAVNGEAITSGGKSTKINTTYRSEINGFWPIPESEIRVTSNLYKQNPGW